MIDFRSDTVTTPTEKMRHAMAQADVGDDVYSEDPTVNRLEAIVAERLGKEHGLFAPSGTQTNLLALLAHCQRGDEYIVGQQAHTYKYEGGGAAVLGSIQPQPLEFEANGSLNLDKVAKAIKPLDFHFARTRLLALENTVGGKVVPQTYMEEASKFAKAHNLAIHLDGARIANASKATGLSLEQLANPFDSVSVCLSKGLCAPVGSVLVGDKAFIQHARRWRKMVGGGMRQAGIIAAAGIIAIDEMVDRLVEDHQNAAYLAERLNALGTVSVIDGTNQTNMVFVDFKRDDVDALARRFSDEGVKVSLNQGVSRLVLHKDISTEDVERFIALCSKVL